jgi:hypothetical protein
MWPENGVGEQLGLPCGAAPRKTEGRKDDERNGRQQGKDRADSAEAERNSTRRNPEGPFHLNIQPQAMPAV